MKLQLVYLSSALPVLTGARPVQVSEVVTRGLQAVQTLSGPHVKRLLNVVNLEETECGPDLGQSMAQSNTALEPMIELSEQMDQVSNNEKLMGFYDPKIGAEKTNFANDNPEGTWCMTGGSMTIGGSYL